MAFKLENFGAEVANAKSTLGGIAYYRYYNEEDDTLTREGYFPAILGLEVADRIRVIPANKTDADETYIVTSVENRTVTVKKVNTGGAVDSVNGKTGAVVLNAKDVEAIPQYTTMPTASAENVGEIVQFTGTTDATYTNGYFYKNVPEYSPSSATVTQTTGSGLTDLAIDVETFEHVEQPSGDETVDFTASEVDSAVTLTPGVGNLIVTCTPQQFNAMFNGDGPETNPAYRVGALTIKYQDGFWYLYRGPSHEYAEEWGGATLQWIESQYGVVVSGNYQDGDYVNYVYTPSSIVFFKDGTQVDIADYGITYSGTPAEGDVLTVDYTAPEVTGYSWKQSNVQPAQKAGIDWKGHWDLPTDFSQSRALPRFDFAGHLADGHYRFYIQSLWASNNYSVEAFGPKTYCVDFYVKTVNSTRSVSGSYGYILTEDTTFAYYGPSLASSFEGKIYDAGTFDTLICDSWEGITSNVPEQILSRTAIIPNCFRWTNLKNVDTEEESTITCVVGAGSTVWPTSYTGLEGYIRTGAYVNIPETTFAYGASQWATTDQLLGSLVANCQQLKDEGYVPYPRGSELRIYLTTRDGTSVFEAKVYFSLNKTTYEIIEATGMFTDTVVGQHPSYQDMIIEYNFPAGLSQVEFYVFAFKYGPGGGQPFLQQIFAPLDFSTFVEFDKTRKPSIPEAPSAQGTYSLQASVDASGEVTLSWV